MFNLFPLHVVGCLLPLSTHTTITIKVSFLIIINNFGQFERLQWNCFEPFMPTQKPSINSHQYEFRRKSMQVKLTQVFKKKIKLIVRKRVRENGMWKLKGLALAEKTKKFNFYNQQSTVFVVKNMRSQTVSRWLMSMLNDDLNKQKLTKKVRWSWNKLTFLMIIARRVAFSIRKTLFNLIFRLNFFFWFPTEHRQCQSAVCCEKIQQIVSCNWRKLPAH